MPQHFLAHVLEDLQKKGVNLLSCTYVLPGKRSGTFLKKHLSRTLSHPGFAPDIHSIQEFGEQRSGLTQSSSVALLFTLYQAYRSTERPAYDNFTTFLKWAPMLLQDFNAMDGALASADALLAEISAIETLQQWSATSQKTPLMEHYFQFWEQLKPLYEAFTTLLLAQQKGYPGLIYRTALNQVQASGKSRGNTPIVFVGFNALGKAEAQLIQHFLEQGNAYCYWDIDQYFLDDPIHDAGFFIRKYRQQWPYYKKRPLLGVHRSFLSPKTITAIGVPKSIAQAKYVGQLLQHIAAESPTALENTALVLADETLLQPVLAALPTTLRTANITMGLPLHTTVLYPFFMSFLQLQHSKTQRGWYYKEVLAFMANPYTVKLSSDTDNFAKRLTQDIKAHNWLYLHPSLLLRYAAQHPIAALLFPQNTPTPLQWIEHSLALINRLKERFRAENNTLELEYLYRFMQLLHQLQAHLVAHPVVTELQALKVLFTQLAAVETLDFIGEPLTGLQIMGMLESRNLDFETVIITSVNEGILPAGKTTPSFIPFDVKHEYGLPTYRENDAIYTYHFYRLIQRAKRVYLIYNTEPDVLEGGEKSRFISQLLTDEAVAPYVTHTLAAPGIAIGKAAPQHIAKSPQLLEAIQAMAARGFSPSSLTNYIRNPLQFYKRNLLHIKEPQAVEAAIAANTFGTLLHNSLEQLYTPLVGTVLTPEKVSSLRPQIPAVVQQHFRSTLPGVDSTRGRFLLVYKVMVAYLRRFVDREIAALSQQPVTLLQLEKPYELSLSIPGLDFPVQLRGTIDRVDAVAGLPRIVDYKTGRVEPKHVTLPDWELLLTDDKSKAFQLLCYAVLYTQHHNVDVLQAGMYSFKNFGQGFLAFTTDRKQPEISSATLTTFTTYLQQLIRDICDPQVPFTEKLI